MRDGMREVMCPACGAIMEELDDERLVVAARAHTLDAHGYDIPREHVLESAQDVS